MAMYMPGQWIEYSPIDNPYKHTGVISALVKDEEGKPTGRYLVREKDMADRIQTVNERFIYRVLESHEQQGR